MLAYVVQRGRVAKPRNILVPIAQLPGMERIGNLLDVFRREVPQYAVLHVAHLSRIDEQKLPTPVPLLAVQCQSVGLVPRQQPDAGRNLCVGEQLPGQGHHTFHVVVFHQLLADFAFVVGAGTHRTIGQQQRHAASGGQVPQHVLQPGKVGIALWGRAGQPAWVVGQFLVPPFLHVEGRVGHHEVGAQVRVQVIQQRVSRVASKIEVNAADGHVHGRQLPGGGVALLAIDADVAGAVFQLAGVACHELFALYEESPRAHGRVVHPPAERLQHFHNEADDALGGVVLAAFPAFGQGKLAQKVLVDVAEDVLGLQVE